MRATLAASLLLAASLPAGCVYAPLDLGGLQNLGKTLEVTLVDSHADEKVFLLRIDGEITDEPEHSLLGRQEGMVANVKESLDHAREDENVKAVLVRISSPGGGVTASDVIYHELLDWKKKTGRPVVAILMDTAASGGYYVAQAADVVVAHPTTITGSIGVIALLPDLHGLGDKIGVQVNVVKSGEMKDMGNMFRALQPAERAIFQKLIDDMHARFVTVVAEGRSKAGLSREAVAQLADGRVYTADDARKAKLVDEVGYFDDAFKRTKDAANLKDAKLVTYVKKGLGAGTYTVYSQAHVEPGPLGLLGRAEAPVVKLEVPGLLPRRREVLNYLWLPEAR